MPAFFSSRAPAEELEGAIAAAVQEERSAARLAMRRVVAAAVEQTETKLAAEHEAARRAAAAEADQLRLELQAQVEEARAQASRATAELECAGRAELAEAEKAAARAAAKAAEEIRELRRLLEAERRAGVALAEALCEAEAKTEEEVAKGAAAAAEAAEAAAAEAAAAALAEIRRSEPIDYAVRQATAALTREHEEEMARIEMEREASERRIWDRAVEFAKEEAALALSEVKSELEARTTEVTELRTRTRGELKAERARWKAEAETELQELKADLHRARAEVEKAHTAASAVQSEAVTELEKTKAALEASKAEVLRMQSELEGSRAEVAAARAEVAAALGADQHRMREAATEVERLEAPLAKFQTGATAESDNERPGGKLVDELNALRAELDKSRANLAKVEAQAGMDLAAERERLQKEAADELTHLKAELEASKAEMAAVGASNHSRQDGLHEGEAASEKRCENRSPGDETAAELAALKDELHAYKAKVAALEKHTASDSGAEQQQAELERVQAEVEARWAQTSSTLGDKHDSSLQGVEAEPDVLQTELRVRHTETKELNASQQTVLDANEPASKGDGSNGASKEVLEQRAPRSNWRTSATDLD